MGGQYQILYIKVQNGFWQLTMVLLRDDLVHVPLLAFFASVSFEFVLSLQTAFGSFCEVPLISSYEYSHCLQTSQMIQFKPHCSPYACRSKF